MNNLGRSLIRSVTTKTSLKSDLIAYYEAHMGHLASNFALCSDLSLVLGDRLKFEEMVSGRLYMLSAHSNSGMLVCGIIRITKTYKASMRNLR